MTKAKQFNNTYNNKTMKNNKNKIIKLSYVKLTKNETEVLNLRYKFNFPYNYVSNIKQNMVTETQIALNKLNITDKEAFKYEAANIINKITSKNIQKPTKEEQQKLKPIRNIRNKY